MNRRREIETERRRAAQAALDGVSRDAEVIGDTGLAQRAARRLESHFTAAEADPDDRIEVWGRRIGRGLAVIAAALLLLQLVLTWGSPR